VKKANERQIGGDHYKVGGEEHWDRAWRLKWDPFQYQITKYVERWKDKGGIDDLRKAQHFLEKYIELLTAPAQELDPSHVKANGWLDFTFEGQTGDGKTLYKCHKCRKTVWVEEDVDPHTRHTLVNCLEHLTDSSEPTHEEKHD
jgi:hypothetical protein